MLQPRNTLVVVGLIEKQEDVVGKVVIPSNNDMYTHATVVAIGPGNVSAAGARSETFDLAVGQTVLVKHKEGRAVGGGRVALSDLGVEYREDGKRYKIFEQTSILGIVAEPVKFPDLPPRIDRSGTCKYLL